MNITTINAVNMNRAMEGTPNNESVNMVSTMPTKDRSMYTARPVPWKAYNATIVTKVNTFLKTSIL